MTDKTTNNDKTTTARFAEQYGMTGERFAEVLAQCQAGTAYEQRAATLVLEGYVQTSRKFRLIGRVPPGMTPLEALRLKDPQTADSFERRFQEQCADYYRRCYAEGDEKLELSIEEFGAFLRLTGRGTVRDDTR